MLRKIVSGLVLATLLVGILALAFNIQLLKASGTIYIRADGSVEGTDKIQRDGDIYTLTGNINDMVVVERDGILIDGMGYVVQGPGQTGIDLSGRNNVTIKNVEIRGFEYGILLWDSSACSMTENIITLNFEYGIGIFRSTDNSIRRNIITINNLGIDISQSNNSMIYGNTITSNSDIGIEFWSSTNNSLYENNVTSNAVGICLHYSSNNNITKNRLENNVGGIGLYSSTDNSVIENDIIHNGAAAIALFSSSNNNICGNNATDNFIGVAIDSSSNYNDVDENTIILSSYGGVEILSSDSNMVYKNTITANNGDGIKVFDGSNNMVYENTITANNEDGIDLASCSNNNIYGNNITDNEVGIRFERIEDHEEASHNNVYRNNVVNNNYGIRVSECSDNYVYHNNFLNNIIQAYSTTDSVNVWDSDYPSGGNYWNNYVGTDNFWGENQNLKNGDMIGDTPYVINEENEDRYPLAEPWPMSNRWAFEDYLVVAITSSSIASFTFSKELGEIGFEIVASTSDSCSLIISKWLLDGAFNFLIENVSAVCPISWSSEFRMINFTYSQGTHNVKIIGEFTSPLIPDFPDINRDGKINIVDIFTVAKHFGEELD